MKTAAICVALGYAAGLASAAGYWLVSTVLDTAAKADAIIRFLEGASRG